MTDRTKTIIFDTLGDSVRGTRVLDLFAGSGSLGLEALSRGASYVTFVEEGPWAYKTIQKNVETLELKKYVLLVRKNAFWAIRLLAKRGETFDIIFLDPPYNKGLVKKILIELGRSDILTPFAQLILHHSRQEKVPDLLKGLKLLREKRIGQACLSFLSRQS